MNTDDGGRTVAPRRPRHPEDAADATSPTPSGRGRRRAERPDWWHRDHPVFTPLCAFFAGLLCVTVVPGTYGGILSALFDQETAERLFGYVLIVFVLPVLLLAVPRTRRFGIYMLVGMIITAVVVLVVGLATIWVLVNRDA